MRLGLLGGTFNPIHYGHLRAAEEVCESLGLERLLFIPAAWPPHKDSPLVAPFGMRLAMTQLAVAGHPRFGVSDIEAERPEKSYSIETLRLFRQRLGEAAELYFVVGLDAFLEIDTWRDYRELFTQCHFVVLDRPGYDRSHLESILTGKVHPQCRYQAGEAAYVHPAGYRIHFQQITLLDISSTQIRRLAGQERSLRYLLPEAVRGYILENRLYRNKEQPHER